MITTIAIGITALLATPLLYLWIQHAYPNKFSVIRILSFGLVLFVVAYGARFIAEAYLAGTLSVIF